jgi:RimJ/RimL family protein N-acetyltransferase
MWDDGFCGTIGFRWQPGTPRLPVHVMGHIGYAVVPWKQRLGHGTRALGLMRGRVRAEGFAYVDLTTDLDNDPSQKVILANGGVAIERFRKPASLGGRDSLCFRWYTGRPHPIEPLTPRLRLRQWCDADREAFAAINADPRVMAHFPSRLGREESDALIERARTAIALRGWGMWAVERREDGRFLGFVGLTVVRDEMPFAPAIEIGWRLAPAAWGQGYATEAARGALRVAFETLELPEVVAYTAARNEPSMAVMRRLGMREDAPFDHPALGDGHPLKPHRLFRLRA